MAGIAEFTGHGTLPAGSAAHFQNIVGHAALGCAMANAAGGSCKSGALAGGFSAAAGPVISGLTEGNFGAGLAGRMAAGCVGSYIGKGSCEAGAVTAAFDYIYNAMGESEIEREFRRHGGHPDGLNLQSLKPYGAHLDENAVRWAAQQTIGRDELNVRQLDGKMAHTYDRAHREASAAVKAKVDGVMAQCKEQGKVMSTSDIALLQKQILKLPEVRAYNAVLSIHITQVNAQRTNAAGGHPPVIRGR